MSIPTITLFEKIGYAKPFGLYWQEKYDKEHPVCKAALQRFGNIDALGIIAVKAGTSRVTVNKVNRILDSDNEDVIKACREMDMSISRAYDLINGGDSDGEKDGVNSDGEKDGGDSQNEAPGKEVVKAEKEKHRKIKQKEIDALAKYSVNGFTSGKVKLDEHGLKFFVLRWNDEHTENCIKEKDVQKAIDNFGKDEK